MKKISLLITVILFSVIHMEVNAQKISSKFSFGADLFTDLWQDMPSGIEARTINQGMNFYGMYASFFKNDNFSLAIGMGLGCHNLYSDGMLSLDGSGVTQMTKIDKTFSTDEEIDYQRNKLSLTYLDVPLAFRFKSDKGFKFSVGFKAGYLLDAHTKYHGDEMNTGERTVKIKEKKLANVEEFRYGPTFSVGYKWIELIGFYSLSKVYTDQRGPDFFPVSAGISMRPF